MVMVHEIQDKRAKKALLGPSTKEGRGLKKSITRKKTAMHKRLDEMYLWKIIGTDKTMSDPGVRLTEAEVKEMLKSGVAPWSSSNTSGIYWLGQDGLPVPVRSIWLVVRRSYPS